MNPPIGVMPDPAGGAVSATQAWYRVDELLALRLGDPVAPHGDDPHGATLIVTASNWYRVSGIGVCRGVDVAACGHVLAASRAWFRVE